MDVTYKVIIKGLVQGVGFRYFVQKKAEAMGLKGWVKNLDTGEVESVIHGKKDIVNNFIDTELKKGPSGAQVNSVSIDEYNSDAEFNSFSVRH